MTAENAGQALRAVLEPLRALGLPEEKSSRIAFGLIVWAYLSEAGSKRIPEDLWLHRVLPNGHVGVVSALTSMAAMGGELGQAFNDAPASVRHAQEATVGAAQVAAHLASAGMFSRFPPDQILLHALMLSRDDFVVAPEVAALMVSLVVRTGSGSLYCPWESTGQFVAALKNCEGHLLVETPWQLSWSALMALMRPEPTTVELVDPLRNPSAVSGGRLDQFEACLAIPPMGMQSKIDFAPRDLFGRFPVPKATATGLMMQHIVAQTHGRAAVIVPSSFLFGLGKDREVREYLLAKGMMEAVISLPTGTHYTTNIPTALLLLNTAESCRQVRFIDATQPYFLEQVMRGQVVLQRVGEILEFCGIPVEVDAKRALLAENPSLAAVVGVDQVLANDANLQVSRYVMSEEQRKLQSDLVSMPKVLLTELVEFIPSVPNKDRGVESPESINVLEVGAADIPSTGYIRKPEKTNSIRLSPRRTGSPHDVFLRPYDVVLIIKGSVGKVGVVPGKLPEPGEGGWIAGQSAVVLRAKAEGQDLRGLALWLRSPLGQAVLDSIRSGAAIQMLSLAELRRLPVISGLDEWTEMGIDVLERESDLQHQIEVLQDEKHSIAEDLWTAFRQAARELAEK